MVVHGTGLARAHVHGNMGHGLGALGSSVASDRRVRGGVHVAVRAALIQGIDHGGQHEAVGEVTEQEVVGGALPRSGTLDGHGAVHGRRGVAGTVLCDVG
jgi:hypothetical protein